MAASSSRPRFSIVGAVYDVAAYLPDFIASVERQDFELSRVEVVMVDDGSTDDSRAVLDAWAARRPELVRVLGQENAGQGAARNAGLEAARGEWVTFPDPDDIVDPDYLSKVDAFLSAHPETVMVATPRVIWDEASGTTTNSHPLRRMFTYDRLADLDVAESSFHGSAPAAFFDLDLLREHDLRFDTRIRPNFEDGHFCASYLLRCERPLVGFLKSARYHYRKRANQSSSLQGSMRDPRRYTDVFEFGYLAIVADAQRLRGSVPLWLQHFLCYELLGYLVAYDVGRVPVIDPGPETESFHRSVRQVLAACDVQRVLPRMEFGSRPEHRAALAHGYDDRSWHDTRLHIDRFDADQQLARVRYFATGEMPAEVVSNGEVPAPPRHAKTCDFAWFGRVLVRERILWVRVAPDLRIALDGRLADLALERAPEASLRVPARAVRRQTGSPSRRQRELVALAEPVPTTALGQRARKRADRASAQRTYADAWVLMDRVHDARDNAEAVFRRLRTSHPEINAWFVLAEDAPDWPRLRKEFGKRVVAHGSLTWRVLMVHCRHLLSSYADPAITRPPEILELTAPSWRFTFLQHGVTTDDRATWIGDAPIDLQVTSTAAEEAWIAGDGSRYPLTTREVRLTGLPRHDALRTRSEGVPPDRRDLVLLAPTWRRWLVRERGTTSGRPEAVPGALDSDFVRQWTALANSAELAEECSRHGLTLAFLPHLNLDPLLARLPLDDHVLRVSRRSADVDDLVARARVLVTDYSSAAFDAAFVRTPVVYFQFDRDVALTGGHVGRPGSFDFQRDGFGPATVSAGAALEAIRAAIEKGPEPVAPYAERMDDAYPSRDGGFSERVIEAVLRSTEPDA